MSEFVKLTSAYGSGAFYINPLRIECFSARKDGGAYVCTSADGDQAYEVAETPEQIMALIDGPADRDVLVADLVGAVRNCIVQIRRLHSEFQETDDGKMVMYHAQRVIDRAEFPS